MSKAGKQRSGTTLAVILIAVYLAVLVGTLKFTGVIKFPEKKKANVKKEAVDKKTKSRTTQESTESADNVATTTTTTTKATETPVSAADQDDNRERLQKLVQIYESMDLDRAAEIISNLSDYEVVVILGEMKEKNAAEVLAAMEPERAARLSKKLGFPVQ